MIDRTFNYYAKQIIQNADCWTETTKVRDKYEVINGNTYKGTEKPQRIVNGLALVPGTAEDSGPWNPRSTLFLEKVFPQLEEEAALDNENHPAKEVTKNYLRTRRGAGGRSCHWVRTHQPLYFMHNRVHPTPNQPNLASVSRPKP